MTRFYSPESGFSANNLNSAGSSPRGRCQVQ